MCAACGRPLRGASRRVGTASLCERAECQALSAKICAPEATFCNGCGVLLGNHSMSDPQKICGSPFCRRWQSALTQSTEVSIRIRAREERSAALTKLAREQAVQELSKTTERRALKVVVLPHFEQNLQPPSAERLQRVKALLLDLASQAHALNGREDDSHELESNTGEHVDSRSIHANTNVRADTINRLLGAGCGMCGGLCCRPGGDSGFLNVAKFREQLRDHGFSNPQESVAAYFDCIPDQTFADSCIFHGRQGCVLTRQQRTVTCNTYLCTSLQQLRDSIEAGETDFLMATTNIRDEDQPKVYRIAQVDSGKAK